MVSSVFEL